jgi:hypothetical protein
MNTYMYSLDTHSAYAVHMLKEWVKKVGQFVYAINTH